MSPRAKEDWFDIVNGRDEVIGKAPRQEVHAKGWRHRAVHMLVVNRLGQVLLQRRSPAKDRHPNAWDSSAAGHVDAGEDYPSAAVRELREELGISSSVEEIFRLPASEGTDQEFVRVYRVIHEGPFQPCAVEVAEVRWVGMVEVDAWVRRAPEEFATGFVTLWKQWRHLP